MNDRLALATLVRDTLRMVIDPELGHNVVDLGLVYDIAVAEDDAVVITMTTTMKGCPATGFLTDAVLTCVRAVEGVSSADVRLVYDPPWSPDRISGDATASFASAT